MLMFRMILFFPVCTMSLDTDEHGNTVLSDVHPNTSNDMGIKTQDHEACKSKCYISIGFIRWFKTHGAYKGKYPICSIDRKLCCTSKVEEIKKLHCTAGGIRMKMALFSPIHTVLFFL